jgi:hypothetical protein
MSTSPIEITLNMLAQEAARIARRAISEDRPDLIADVHELATLAERLARAFDFPSPLDAETYTADIKKRFLLSTTLTVVPGIFSDDVVAAPIDPVPLRRNSRAKLGVGLAEHRQQKVAIDAPCFSPDQRCYGFIIPAEPLDEWYMVREQSDLSYVMTLEHEWITSSGVDMVMVKDVIGIGRYALNMSNDSRPGLTEWISRARDAFDERYAALSPEEARRGVPGFYHFGRERFYRTPWGEIKNGKT